MKKNLFFFFKLNMKTRIFTLEEIPSKLDHLLWPRQGASKVFPLFCFVRDLGSPTTLCFFTTTACLFFPLTTTGLFSALEGFSEEFPRHPCNQQKSTSVFRHWSVTKHYIKRKATWANSVYMAYPKESICP